MDTPKIVSDWFNSFKPSEEPSNSSFETLKPRLVFDKLVIKDSSTSPSASTLEISLVQSGYMYSFWGSVDYASPTVPVVFDLSEIPGDPFSKYQGSEFPFLGYETSTLSIIMGEFGSESMLIPHIWQDGTYYFTFMLLLG